MKRRTLLKTGLAGGMLLALGTASLLIGREPADDRDTVLRAVVPAMLDGALPADPISRSSAVDRCVSAAGAAAARLAPSAQAELAQLFALLASGPGRVLLARVDAPWHRADIADVSAFLSAWRTHRVALFKTGYGALHDLVLAGFYADDASWPGIGYPGPPRL
jgi:hypothetical protein